MRKLLDDVFAFVRIGQPDLVPTGLSKPSPTDVEKAFITTSGERLIAYAEGLKDVGSTASALGARLMLEELGETLQAMASGNLEEYADGLADLVYVTVWNAVVHGIPLHQVWAEVQRANMAKFPVCTVCEGIGFPPRDRFADGRVLTVSADPCEACAGKGRIVLREAGKIIKPTGWFPPPIDLALIKEPGDVPYEGRGLLREPCPECGAPAFASCVFTGVPRAGVHGERLPVRADHAGAPTGERNAEPAPQTFTEKDFDANGELTVDPAQGPVTIHLPGFLVRNKPPRHGIYVASRTRYAPMWRKLRDEEGYPIVSSWIDKGVNVDPKTHDFDAKAALWRAITTDIKQAAALVLYTRDEDLPLQGALVEVGAALSRGIPVYVCEEHLGSVGDWIWTYGVTNCARDIHDALNAAKSYADAQGGS